MELCVENWFGLTNEEKESDCSIQTVTILGNIFWVYCIILILIYRKCCLRIRERHKRIRVESRRQNLRTQYRGKLFQHHVSIWILTFVLFLFLFCDFGESIIIFLSKGNPSSSSDSESGLTLINHLRLWTPITTLISLTFLSYFYLHVETTQESSYTLLNILYFIFFFCITITKLELHLVRQSLSIVHVKVIVDVASGILTLTLVLLLIHAYLLHVCLKRKDNVDLGLKDVKYFHYYSTLPSRLSFYWFTALLWIGYNQPLEEEDLGSLPLEEKAEFQYNRFNKIYQVEKEKSKSDGKQLNLWKCMFKTLWSSLIIGAFFRLCADFSGFVAPLGIRTIVDYVKKNQTDVISNSDNLTMDELFNNGYIMAFAILISAILQSTFSQCSTFLVNSEGIHIKVALQALIYNKSLTLSPTKSSNYSQELEESNEDLQSIHKEGDDCRRDSNDGSSESGRQESTRFDTGSILHIVSEDTTNVMTFFWMAHFIWAIPLKLGILMILLYMQLGYSALIGAGICIMIMIPFQFYIGRRMSLNSREMMERCDERLRSMSEILQGMKLLKVHGWEIVFSQHLLGIRRKELKNLDRDLLYRSIMTFLTHISSVLVTLVTFGLYPYIETDKLEPAKVFSGLALFNQLTVPLFIFPITVPVVIDAIVSAKRIKDFLLLPETMSFISNFKNDTNTSTPSIDRSSSGCSSTSPKKKDGKNKKDKNNLKVPKTIDLQTSSDSVFGPIQEEEEEEEDDESDDEFKLKENLINTFSAEPLEVVEEICTKTKAKLLQSVIASSNDLLKEVVSVENGDFSWEEDRHDQTLNEITTKIPKGKLTLLVGSIGSGKSSFISAILGEIKLMKGQVQWRGNARVAYAAQKPWIQNGSLRENILFGKEYKPRRYKKVIDACGLQADIDILPAKDFTEIGEKGINLSGGQRQRVGIARALYNSNANVILLDDVLSALDVTVAHEVFNTGIKHYLINAGKTVLLATHHLPALTSADHIIALEKGRIRIQGTLSEIKERDPQLYAQWKEIMTKKEAEIDNKAQAKTGKERWAMLKLVSKIGLQFKNKAYDGSWKNEDNVKPILEQYRKRKATFSTYRHFSNDMFLPSDDCCDEIMTPLLRRRGLMTRQTRLSRESRTSASSNNKNPSITTASQSKQHPNLMRMTSLQVEDTTKPKGVLTKVKRLKSLPVNEETVPPIGELSEEVRERADTFDSSLGQRPHFFKRFLSVNTKSRTLSSIGSSGTELDNIQRLPSTLSGASESDYPDDDDDEAPKYALLAREQSSEDREYGKIPMKVYLTYISACGRSLSFLYLLFAIGYEVVRVYTNFWLKEWSDEISKSTGDDDYSYVMSHYFQIYVILSIISILVSLSLNLIGKQAGANSREKLHGGMLNRIVRCQMKFFDSTPIGRILNRFSSDVAVVDRKLCISMQRFLQFVFLCLSAVVVNAIVNPWFLIVAVPIIGIYYYIQRFYRFSSRELQRIEAISRGPIYSHFHETLEGLSTIRAFKEEQRFAEEMFAQIDLNNTAAMFINVGNRWLSISLDYLGSVIVYMATTISMISAYLYPETVTPSMVGLAINYTLLVPVYLNWVVKFLAEVEMFMTSVDRIDRYSKAPIEDYGDETESNRELANWPSNGKVQFENTSIQYSPDRPRIIQDLSLIVPPKEKLGICGRSGSGKSSLLMSIFRVADICEGRILIDDVDIYKVPLLKLRSSLSIIPQENLVFSGTLRFNLDPLKRSTDPQIWKALELAQMKEVVLEMQGGLDAEIKDGGSSFSGGQKQLLGLARAILHNSKLVILDEATSSVDLATEKLILKVVKEAFKDSTVLTIAHRLDTISDGNRIIVLDGGIVVEDGRTKDLLRNPNSIFKTMMQHANEQGHLH